MSRDAHRDRGGRRLTPEAAWRRLARHLEPLEPVEIERRRALGRVLAAPLFAGVDVPASDVSAMDGYAYRGEVAPGTALEVVATVAAGDAPGMEVPENRAVAIMTGAPVPSGTDRVIPIERTDGGRRQVRLLETVDAGANIRRRAEVVAVGEEILARGTLVTPGALSLIATHGHGEIPVFRPPRVAVLTTGDEVVPPDDTPGPGQLRDSHTDFLLAAGQSLGLDFEPLGIAPDDPAALRSLIAKGLEADVLLLGGGVSMGEFDFVEDVLTALGCEVIFDHVAIQPGKPLLAARHAGGLVLGLPGNPASVMACFWLFARPVLRRLQGIDDGFWRGAIAGRLATRLPGGKGRDRFLPARVVFGNGELAVHPVTPKGSHDLGAYGRGSALVRIGADAEARDVGASCEILPLVDWPSDP